MSSNHKVQDYRYWRDRPLNDPKKDWQDNHGDWIEGYQESKSHPHRKMIISALEDLAPFDSVLEVGCNCAPNLVMIQEFFPQVKVSGVDINEQAIKRAQSFFSVPYRFKVASAQKLPFKDKSFDVVLTDAMLLYVGPKDIERVMSELERVAKKGIILVEWYAHGIKLGILKEYHWARDYEMLLEKRGWIVEKQKIPSELWPTKNWIKNGFIFTAHRLSQTSASVLREDIPKHL